jgi:hypothetical protein
LPNMMHYNMFTASLVVMPFSYNETMTVKWLMLISSTRISPSIFIENCHNIKLRLNTNNMRHFEMIPNNIYKCIQIWQLTYMICSNLAILVNWIIFGK